MLNLDNITSLLSENDAFLLTWKNDSLDPRSLKNAELHFHTKTHTLIIPLLDSIIPELVCLIKVLLEQKPVIILVYDVKDLIVALSHSLKKQDWKPIVPWSANFYDLALLDRFSGQYLQVPQSLQEALTRLKGYTKLIPFHRKIHLPLSLRTIPEVESNYLYYSHYIIEGQVTGRLNCDKLNENYYVPHTFDFQIDQNHALLDYHAMEVATLAFVSDDRKLKKILERNDVYETIGKYLFNEPDTRDLVKQTFLPVMYGIQPHGLSELINLPGEQIIEEIHSKFPQCTEFMHEIEKQAKTSPITDSVGRTRIYEPPHKARASVVQSPAAAFCHEKLIELVDVLPKHVAASIHDGFYISANGSCLNDLLSKARVVLESPSNILEGLVVRIKERKE